MLVNQSSTQSDDDESDGQLIFVVLLWLRISYFYWDKQNSDSQLPTSKLFVEQGETRYISVPEAVGLDFHSFIPQADITSQVHFFSNIHPDSQASSAGLKDGDRILQINGVNVTNLEHEDVRKLMQLMTPIIFTVANDPKYLLLLQEPVHDIEEKPPGKHMTRFKENSLIEKFFLELPVISAEGEDIDLNDRRKSRFELKTYSSIHSLSSTISGTNKSRRSEIFNITQPDVSTNEESLKAKVCHLRRSKRYDGYGLVLKFQQHLHIIGEVEQMSPSYRAGLRENDVILFVGKTNVEKSTHDDVKVMIRAMTLASNQVDLTVLAKSDIPKYKVFQEKGLIDWSVMGLEK